MKSSFRRRLLALFGAVTMGALVGCGAIPLENLGIIQRAYVGWVWVYETKDGFTQTARAEFEAELTEFGPDQDGNGLPDSIWSPTGKWRVVDVSDVDLASAMGVSGNTDYAGFEMVDVGEWIYPTDPYGGRDYGDVNDRIGDKRWKTSSEDAKRSYSIKYRHLVQKDIWVPNPSTNPPATSRPSEKPSVVTSSSAPTSAPTTADSSSEPYPSSVMLPAGVYYFKKYFSPEPYPIAYNFSKPFRTAEKTDGTQPAEWRSFFVDVHLDTTVTIPDDGDQSFGSMGFGKNTASFSDGEADATLMTWKNNGDSPSTEDWNSDYQSIFVDSGTAVTIAGTTPNGTDDLKSFVDYLNDSEKVTFTPAAIPTIYLDDFIVGTTPDKPFSDADIKALIVAAHRDDIQPDTVWIDASEYRANWNKPGKSEIPFAYRDSTNDPVRGILTVSVAGN